MFPFWDSIIAPIIKAADAKRFVEIGALRGETTVRMLEDLGPDAELHVIDPVPEFDPTAHEKRFGGRYVFHRDLSLNVLDKIGPMDVALVDGDHNWYTVYNELRLLREASQQAGKHLPVLILHDVCWPYGRRDLYYAPDQIPAEFRQPYQKGGMRPENTKLLERGGLNAQMDNALVEGGPRNGVMTGLDDFIAEHPNALRTIVLPIYWGLAIVVEEARLAETPELVALLDHIESDEGKEELLLLSEQIRLDSAMFEQNVWRLHDRKISEGTRRYLDLLKATVVGDLGADEERVGATISLLDTVRTENVSGNLLVAGVDPGDAVILRGYLAAHHMWLRKVWIADPTAPVQTALTDARLWDDGIRTVGDELTLPAALEQMGKVAVLHLGPGSRTDLDTLLEATAEFLTDGATIIVDGSDDADVAATVDRFRTNHSVATPLQQVGPTTIAWRHTHP